MVYTLTRIYKAQGKEKGEIILQKAVKKNWITEAEMQQIIKENK